MPPRLRPSYLLLHLVAGIIMVVGAFLGGTLGYVAGRILEIRPDVPTGSAAWPPRPGRAR